MKTAATILSFLIFVSLGRALDASEFRELLGYIGNGGKHGSRKTR
jgi:hypothetical protein